MSESITPLISRARPEPSVMSLDFGPSVSSPLPIGDRGFMSFDNGSIASSLSSPRVLLGGSPYDVTLHRYPPVQPDPLSSVQQQQLLLESRVGAAVAEKRERRREREGRRRQKQEAVAERVQELARSIEVDRSRVAQQTFEAMIQQGNAAEEMRRERWQQQQLAQQRLEEEKEMQREAAHRRELERQRELNAEREKLAEKVLQMERVRKQDDEAAARLQKEREKVQQERFAELQRQNAEEIQRLREELQRDRKSLEDRLEAGLSESRELPSRENTLLTAQIASLKHENSMLNRQLTDARDELRSQGKSHQKEMEKLRGEAEEERRTRYTAQDRLEREKLELENSLHQRQRDFEIREWKLQQEVDELRKHQKASASSDGYASVELTKERNSLQAQLKEEREKSSRQILELQREAVTFKEREAASAARLQLEKERQDGLQRELDEAKHSLRETEDARRALHDELHKLKWSQEKAADDRRVLEKTVSDLETRVKAQTASVREKELQLREKENLLETTNTQVRQAEGTVLDKEQNFRRREETLRKELDDALGEMRILEATVESEKRRHVDETKRASALTEKSNQLDAELSQAKVDLATRERELQDLKAKVRQKDSDMSSLADIHKEELEDLKKRKDKELASEVQKAALREKSLSEEVASLQEDLREVRTGAERMKKKETSTLQSELEALSDKERELTIQLEDSERKAKQLREELKKEREDARDKDQDHQTLSLFNRELKVRGDLLSSEKMEMLWLYSAFIEGTHRCAALAKSRASDDLDRMKQFLEREKEDSKLLQKDVDELQYKLRRAQEDQTVEGRVRELRADLNKETQQRTDAEREARELRRELDDLRAGRTTGDKALEEAERARRELQKEVDALRQTARTTRAAPAAGPSVPTVPPHPDAPQWLVLRASAELCEIKAEANTVEENNGLYTLVQGGLSELLKDSTGQRNQWPLAGCVWERKLPQPRWLYSSRKGAWKVTDGMRENNVFDLTQEVDEGRSFEALVRNRTPHEGVLPHKFRHWCRGVTCDPPPEQLSIVADKTASTGQYLLVPGKIVNGWPVWHLSSPTKRWLYNTLDGSWQITDSEAEFEKGGGLVLDAKHKGVLPHLVPWDAGVAVSLYAPGDRVKVRDYEEDAWRQGVVESIAVNGNPVVRADGQSRGFQWQFVEKPSNHYAVAADEDVAKLKAKNAESEKIIRDQEEQLRSERSRIQSLERQLSSANNKVEELEKDLKMVRVKGGGSSQGSGLERKLQQECDRRVETERQLAQFKEAAQRNEKLLMDVYEEKARLESKIKDLEKRVR